jgi:hypothetical protein
MKKYLFVIFFTLLLSISTQIFPAEIPVSGKITRIISDTTSGGCLVGLDSAFSVGSSGCAIYWASLDCANTYLPAGTGNRSYATALLAASLGKQVSMWLDDSKIHTSYRNTVRYCTVTRIDLIY